MGQKVNPIGFRIGVTLDHPSRWCARNARGYAEFLADDLKIRDYIKKNLSNAEIARIEIERAGDAIRVIVHSARPGVVIGKKGQEIDVLRKKLALLLPPGKTVDVSVQEVKKPELSARILADSIAEQLVRRVGFKKAAKKAAVDAMRAGAKGVKVRVKGRLGGAEIAREEWVRLGSVPLHTLRADIDYYLSEAHTTYGVIGVKVWVYRGEFGTV
ncbi:MAG: 30S ribosomal protein S3 [Candidatus Babeliaceae bacterium]|nr:30S ribosomal protein S3 [Candidatus Babeliaceae bacterium]